MNTVKKAFEQMDGELSVTEAYIKYASYLQQNKMDMPKVYLSNALTSGGYRRDPILTFEEGFLKNANLSDSIRRILYRENLLDPSELVFFPGDTRQFDGWNQFEYNLFFGFILIGITDVTRVQEIEDYVRGAIDMSGFIKDRSTREERIHSYSQLIEYLEKFIKDQNIPNNPSTRLVQLLDTDMSLGAWYESELARRFGAKILRVKINTELNHSDPEFQRILEEVRYLENLGMDFFKAENNTGEAKIIHLVEM